MRLGASIEAVCIALLAMAAAPVWGQAPQTSTFNKELADAVRTCRFVAASRPGERLAPQVVETAVQACFEALAKMDAVYEAHPDASPANRAYFYLQSTRTHINIASMQRNSDPPGRPGRAACASYERGLASYAKADRAALDASNIKNLDNWGEFLDRYLPRCREQFGKPAVTIALPNIPRRTAPEPALGTLVGDGNAATKACFDALADRATPASIRDQTCAAADKSLDALRLRYPDASPGDVAAFEFRAANMMMTLGLNQSSANSPSAGRACASLQAAYLARERVRAIPGYAFMAEILSPLDAPLAACQKPGPTPL